ncbi:threonylcarbamoyladenosine tRNA methylthiotransferase-like [Amphibalanus amphitrite]|uniref:threonylcarbamoyladenosine tRNA methylthiotransferase-like n=1 Tax=Amphibalanus amphitrite TaxID=1232801 RepID=UPI001C9215AE|nr:threonylcarbamoyladenosine tRNA methylthiotransferase-like [Amphibalanus amphitrite]XP_043197220.1 threonylcarbamoyladenosine tRNA methylthiotransferase-like [Amphibalanus amphitrite]XP_043197221.1 threonylcarbamoyladenosine tRNA methylthiotransferase-like [Amphibalanus amphitrite]XP_043197222.1 threonylcarbamoyladenosine tRNA methylthiotransferase-like [Amphibalanus amphitrite]
MEHTGDPCTGLMELDDIEDLIGDGERPRRVRTGPVVRARRKKTETAAAEPLPDPPVCDSVVPGTQRVHVRTWGCTHNSSDSEYMAGQLAAYGYIVTDDADSADLWLLNSCTVKSPAESHFRNEVERGRRAGKHVVVAGCVPQGAPRSDYLQGLSVIGVQQIDRVVEVVEETLKGHTVRLYGQKKDAGKKLGGAPLLLPKIRKNPLIEIIPINTGCLNQCTYCKTKHARGELGSYPIEEIVSRASAAFSEGVCEVWLTSEDTGAYGIDLGVTLPQLLWRLVEVVPEGGMLRVGMTNPPYILDHLEEISRVLRHPRVYSFLHVPVQSGSDSVLEDMKREYFVKDFRRVVDFLKERVPDVTICTDIICGFPTETEKDFERTLELCAEYKFPSLFINQFYPRPGTPAAKMQRVPTQEVKRRTRALTELFHSYRPYDHLVGRRQRVLVTEISHDRQYFVGHNKAYQQVLVPMDADFMGQLVTVEIVSASKFSMISRVVGSEGTAVRAPAPAQLVSSGRSLPLPLVATFVAAVAYLVLRLISVW